jgi:hypothetical protein
MTGKPRGVTHAMAWFWYDRRERVEGEKKRSGIREEVMKKRKGEEKKIVIVRLMCCRQRRRNEGVLGCIYRKGEDKEYRRGWSH